MSDGSVKTETCSRALDAGLLDGNNRLCDNETAVLAESGDESSEHDNLLKLHPALSKYRDLEKIGAGAQVKIVLCLCVVIAVVTVLPLLDVHSTWWYIAYIGISAFAIAKIIRELCAFFTIQKKRLQDPDNQDAFRLYTRRFISECRDAIDNGDKA